MRGWLHGNVVRLPGALIDTGYHTGVDVLRDRPVQQILLTHVHADHAGGVAALVEAHGATVHAHPDARALVDAWDRRGLWLEGTGQQLPRFPIHQSLGASIEAGGRRWQVIETPGHAVGGVSFFDARHGTLVCGDALWEDGFGMLNVWFDPPGVFERTHATLARLATIDAAWVIPGHGAPFSDLRAALRRARQRLAYLEARPDRLRVQLIRNLAQFLRLSRPDDPHATWADQVRRLAAGIDALPGDDGPSSEAIAAQITAPV